VEARTSERSQGGNNSGGRHLEHRSKSLRPSMGCRAVKIAVVAQGYPPAWLRAITASGEGVDRTQCPVGRNFEDAPLGGCPAAGARAIKIAIASQRQGAVGSLRAWEVRDKVLTVGRAENENRGEQRD